jgi:hypothetical protein
MAAGLGFKTFAVGEILSAANVNGYLMQGVLVFADATARDAAITSPQEGQFAYLKDTNVTTYYTGSAWANLDTTGMTNPMTTTGDVIYSSSGSTPARLELGTAGQVLKVNSGATAPEWGAAGGASGMTLISKTTYSSVASQIIDTVFTSTYTNYMIVIEDWIGSATGLDPRFQLRKGATTQTAAYYGSSTGYAFNSASLVKNDSSNAAHFTFNNQIGTGAGTFIVLNISRVGTGSNIDAIWSGHGTCDSNGDQFKFGGIVANNDNYTGFVLSTDSGTSSGSVSVYGLAKV